MSLGLLGLDVGRARPGGEPVAVLDALLGMALGLFVCAFATTEFQAVQFMPAVVIPQILLCGLIVRDDLPDVLRWCQQVLPLTYAVEATRQVLDSGHGHGDVPGRRGGDRRVRRGPAGPGLGDPATTHPLTGAKPDRGLAGHGAEPGVVRSRARLRRRGRRKVFPVAGMMR